MTSSPGPTDKRPRLRPRARLLRTLGEELISNEVVALVELVKNAYDADATRVLIRFVPPLQIGTGQIEVIDNGHGMAIGTLQTVWMEPATPSKRGRTRSETLGRRYLGQKGIGRFASSRLADELEVASRQLGDAMEAYALFDWRQFDDEDAYLDEIIVLCEERSPVEICPSGTIQLLWRNDADQPPKAELSHGTVLRMAGFKQVWGRKQFEDLRRGLARLISPGLEKRQDFQIELDLPAEFAEFGSKVRAPDILKHPHYTVKGSVGDDGNLRLTYKVAAEGLQEEFKGRFLRFKEPRRGGSEVRFVEGTEIPKEAEKLDCGPLEIELRVWDRDELGNVVQRTHSTVRDVRRDLDAVAGVNIYRDGFRVLPYGEPQDDWLRLDLRRVQNPTLRLSNNQIYGIVHITADGNPSLRDQSNREGLDENQALQDLRGVMIAILSRLEELRYRARPRSSKKASKSARGLFGGFDLGPLSEYITKQLPEDRKAKELLEATEVAIGDRLKDIQTVLARYQRLATLGQLIDHVLHEGRQPVATIVNEADLGLGDTRRARETNGALIPRLEGRFTTIRNQGDVLSAAFRRMEPFGGRKRGRPAQLYLEEIVRDAFSVFASDLRRLGVKLTLPRSKTLVRVDPAEMQEVVVNLLLNSLYWLEQVDQGKREIIVKIDRKAPDHLEISFSDSGPGIPAQNRELIFDPYFSTRPEGVGLGLSIAGEIVSDYYAGSLELLQKGHSKGANFLITLRKRI
jgi:signal transduction histidine kinase